MPLVWLAAAGMTGYYIEKTSANLVPVALAGVAIAYFIYKK